MSLVKLNHNGRSQNVQSKGEELRQRELHILYHINYLEFNLASTSKTKGSLMISFQFLTSQTYYVLSCCANNKCLLT